MDFTKHRPPAVVYARGTTAARTRLYQIGIYRHRAEISQPDYVKGVIEGVLFSFEPGRNYEAFVLAAKEKNGFVFIAINSLCNGEIQKRPNRRM